MYPGYMHGGFGSFPFLGIIGGILGLLFTLALIVGAILLVIWIVRSVTNKGGTPARSDLNSTSLASRSPVEILQARYARGEINREEYQQMLNDISPSQG